MRAMGHGQSSEAKGPTIAALNVPGLPACWPCSDWM